MSEWELFSDFGDSGLVAVLFFPPIVGLVFLRDKCPLTVGICSLYGLTLFQLDNAPLHVHESPPDGKQRLKTQFMERLDFFQHLFPEKCACNIHKFATL